MNIPIANALASEMINRLVHAPNFFLTAKEFDQEMITRAEYDYAIQSAVAQRAAHEEDGWLVDARKFLAQQGVAGYDSI